MSSILTKYSAAGRIMRVMSVFSGVRVLIILCSLVRNKLIAWLIGPAGLGLVMLYNSLTELIGQASRLSIEQSAQRDISCASSSQVSTAQTVVRRWALWLGIVGMLIMCLLSPLLSYISFDSVDRWPTFCLLSLVPLFYATSSCINTENQGLRRFKALALSNIWAAITGLVITVPLIIWLRITSIAWIIVTYAVASWATAMIYRPRIDKVNLKRKEIVEKGFSFIKLGIYITTGIAITQTCSYVFVLFLNNYASTDILGIYQSGFTVMNSYVGIIFTALWMEYYPRLAALSHSPKRTSLAASHEVRLSLMVITPLLCLLILCVQFVIRLVYTSEFMAIAPYIVVACIGVIFRTLSWCQAYVILARGDGRVYLMAEILSNIVGLSANVAGYLWGGFLGLGIAYLIWYASYTVIVGIICHRKYKVTYSAGTWGIAGVSLAVVTCTAVIYYLWHC